MSTELEQFYSTVGTQQPDSSGSVTWSGVVPAPEPSGTSNLLHAVSKAYLPGVSRWAVQGDRFWGIAESLQTLDAGCYTAGISQSQGVYLKRHAMHTDSLLYLPDSKVDKVLTEIKEFTTLRSAFQKRGFLFKRGVLLHGPAGSGKTSCIHLVIKLFAEQMNGICLLAANPALAIEALRLIRTIEPLRQIVCVIEDLDEMVAQYGVSEYLSLLDGESQIDNVLYMATTNFPERLDRRFVDRPSRFDTVEYVGMPSAEARRMYLERKEPSLSTAVLDEMVDATEGLSVAHLREMIILTQCFGRSVAEAATRLNAAKHKMPHSDKNPDQRNMGFSFAQGPRLKKTLDYEA
jgi:hypothetical protein